MGAFGGRGGGLSFGDADVVPFTFDLDFPEGLSCRESTVDESGRKAVPYRTLFHFSHFLTIARK